MKNITLLGPLGATFSEYAYRTLAKQYGAPALSQNGEVIHCIPAPSNSDIVGLVCTHGGYGVIAMDTKAEGRVAEPLESFIGLLTRYHCTHDCPLHVLGAMRLTLNFCLMARHSLEPNSLKGVITHQKSLGACKNNVAQLHVPTQTVSSNGEAARLVAENDQYARYGAIGPRSAAEKYGLTVLKDSFEDQHAVTSFFLLGPREHNVSVGKSNRALIVFKVPHEHGALVKALMPFSEEGLNLSQIHSMYVGNHTYNFAIEIEIDHTQLQSFEKAKAKFAGFCKEYISFGPFEVLSQ